MSGTDKNHSQAGAPTEGLKAEVGYRLPYSLSVDEEASSFRLVNSCTLGAKCQVNTRRTDEDNTHSIVQTQEGHSENCRHIENSKMAM
jgi:hypothetical protein